MDVVMSAVHTAEKAFTGGSRGDVSGVEPVSGVKGAGTASDPYDAGNAAKAPGQGVENPIQGIHSTSASSNTPTAAGGDVVEPPRSNHPRKTDPPSKADKLEMEQDTGVDAPERAKEFPSAPGVAKSAEPTPSVGGEQGDVQGGAQPHAKPGDEATPSSSYSGSKGGAGEEGAEAESKGSKGTGEKYVKSTGFAAEGGNFDATEPGAGREADRLLEEKGETAGGAKDASQPSGGHGEAQGKGHGKAHSPKFSKVKEKLHIGKHHA